MDTKSKDTNSNVVQSSVPIGMVVAYGGLLSTNNPPPDGWLLCDGSAMSRTKYSTLFGVIGTLHGSGDGLNTFNIPDYTGKFQRGVDDGTGRDPNAATRLPAREGGVPGDVVGSIQGYGTGIPDPSNVFTTTKDGEHSHAVPHLPNDCSYYSISGGHYANWNPNSVNSSNDGDHIHTINGGGDTESRPVNVYANYIIYYGQNSN